MDNIKKFLAIFLGVFIIGTVATGAYLDEISVLIGGSAPSQTNPLPVRITDGTNYVATLPVSLTSTTISNFPAVQPVNDNGGSLTVDGTVAVSNFPATQPVSGTVTANAGTGTFQTNVTNSTLAVTQSGAWSVGVNNFPAVQPVSDNGGSLTVDGTVAATQSGTWNITNITGTVSLPTGASTSALQTTGNTSLGNIDTDLDVALSTRASAANQTNGTQKTRVTSDGTNDALVTNVAPATSAYAMAVRPISLELATYSAVATNVVVGNNKSMIAIQNTGTSVVRIREIWIINDRTTAVTGIAGLFEVRRITSFTGGTAITPVSYDTSDTLPAGITAATGSTVSGEGVLLRSGVWSTDEWGPGTLDTESLDHALQQQTPFWSQTMNGKALTIRQNQGIHVKFATNSTAGEFNIRFVFTVE